MLIDNKHLFPLDRAIPSLKPGYFVDADMNVYSNRQQLRLRKLAGSRNYRAEHTEHTYTFQTKFSSAGRVNYSDEQLRRTAMAHADFSKETMPKPLEQPILAARGVPRAHASTVEDGIKARGWVIGRVHNGRLVFGSEPKIHVSDQSVKDEMAALAQQHPGTKFVKLHIEQSVVSGGVTWE